MEYVVCLKARDTQCKTHKFYVTRSGKVNDQSFSLSKLYTLDFL